MGWGKRGISKRFGVCVAGGGEGFQHSTRLSWPVDCLKDIRTDNLFLLSYFPKGFKRDPKISCK